ncbi:hypothetical protein [Clostridium beijerinckii]|uniref:ABC transmembrane type-1 domain-containing protein n=1 Tax=Clostridium beijerinckii TaxID=1520 RepID=A0AAW3W6X6_CLOBE|nr:hypothetical protein [Clostridium beijerinckii]MBC2457547.1 hypothetical protein [Clostridium beijerinckii]MBC2474628.1 hypothetical protein [Clostridium beijerinckii]NOV62415.1 hypothetical protein [Clostridium beijerinckii]NOV68088.1 hypothetical protein [Clostridium beijerinckii]NOW30467.1 hypothetical protein [Clostridium beijerinckii]
MSTYILLIMNAYIEREKSEPMLKPKKWIDFFKENIIVTILFGLAIVALISVIVLVFIKTLCGENFIKTPYWEIGIVIASIVHAILIIILFYISEKEGQKNYKNRLNKYEMKLNILRYILKYEFYVYEQKKIEELIKQCNSAIKFHQISNKIFKSLSSLTKSALFPIMAFSFGLMAKKVKVNINDIIILTILTIWIIVMFWILFHGIKHYVEIFLDGESNKFKKLKGMLNDIIIKDFLKDENKKSNFELYNSGSN